MDNFLDQALNMNLAETAKFQSMKYLRDQLIEQDFSTDAANMIACTMKLEVSDELWQDNQDDIKRHLDKFALLIARLYDEVDAEFLMDVDLFIKTFCKDLSYELTV
jgi:hypothetical protein